MDTTIWWWIKTLKLLKYSSLISVADCGGLLLNGDQCYYAVTGAFMNYSSAQDTCSRMFGGHLAYIKTNETHSAVTDYMTNIPGLFGYDLAWIGASYDVSCEVLIGGNMHKFPGVRLTWKHDPIYSILASWTLSEKTLKILRLVKCWWVFEVVEMSIIQGKRRSCSIVSRLCDYE